MFRGLRTVIYHVEDLGNAKEWYSEVLGFEPYFDEPFYVGFNVGGYELGLDPDLTGVTRGDGAVAYWGVGSVASVYAQLLGLGAREHSAPREVGGGIVVATLKDPWDNVFGIIENPHFKVGAAE